MTDSFWIISIICLAALIIFLMLFKKSSQGLSEPDAKRFARLLVSEIRLYETYKYERGLRNNKLYESLEDEIEAARKKYKKRFSSVEFEEYFDEAVIAVLADGDSRKLGIVNTSLNQ